MGQKTIGQLYADHPASSLVFTDLIEVEQGGLSKGATLEKIALAGIINPLNAQINVDTTYTIANSPAIYTVIIPKAYLLSSNASTQSLIITTGVANTETVIVPISPSSDTITSSSLMFNLYIDATGNVYSDAWTISGSNSNGSYVKSADGTQICRYSYSAVMNLATLGPVSLFYYQTHTWNFPASFKDTSYVFGGNIRTPDRTELFSPELANKTVSSCIWFDLCLDALGNLTAYVDVWAIGPWK